MSIVASSSITPKLASIPVVQLPHGQGLPLPSYATHLSAGMDLFAAVEEDNPLIIQPDERVLVPTALTMALPEGYEAQIRPRSGLAFKYGVTVINTPGTIDADYRGEIKVILINLSEVIFKVTRGMRIAQMIITPYKQVSLDLVDSLSETGRGTGGFGSTGF